jgi:hypothetical protein
LWGNLWASCPRWSNLWSCHSCRRGLRASCSSWWRFLLLRMRGSSLGHCGERWCLGDHVQLLHRPLLPPARRALRCCRQVDAIPPPPVAVLVEAAASCAPVALNGAERAETSPWAALRSADAPPVWEVACDRVRTPDGALRLSAFRFFEAMLVEGVDPGCSTGAP